MTSKPQHEAFVWIWLPGATAPVVAGRLDRTGALIEHQEVVTFAYARSYLERDGAISLFTPELPLRRGRIDPTTPPADSGWRGYPIRGPRSALPLAGCLRDAAPDAWGRRVLNLRLHGTPEIELDELTYLLHSGSDRIGALDFQASPTTYIARGETATLEQLLQFVALVEAEQPIPQDLAAAAGHGTSVGGARPKALLDHKGRRFVAKFSSSADSRPVVKAEAVGMILARRAGINAAPVEVVRAAGKDVLLVERFDRTRDGARRLVLSALTVLGLRETEAHYASYADLAEAIRYPGWSDAGASLRELFRRLVFNICIGNTDDHLRNHAAFWDGESLRLTPAYDLCPQIRSTNVASHAIGITRDRANTSQLRLARAVAADFGLTPRQAEEAIEEILAVIRGEWDLACDEATLTQTERAALWEREILNPYIFYENA
jgi:serine/threonine-protein kinase HipA